LAVSSFLSFTLFFFGPAHIYFSNIKEFSSSFFNIFPAFLMLSVVCAIILAAVSAFLKAFFQPVISLLFCCSSLLWLQGNVLVWNYGLLDGREINWSAKGNLGLIDCSIWIILLIAGGIWSGRISKIAPKISLILIFAQILSFIFILSKTPNLAPRSAVSSPNETSVYDFSPQKNVIVLVLDSFPGDIFQEIIEEAPYYRDFFDGFTYYRNALSGYPVTKPSVALILTGHFYDNSIPFQEYLKTVFSEKSLPKILMDNRYQVDLVGATEFLYADRTIASSVTDVRQHLERNTGFPEALFLLDISLFRHLPHFLKKCIYNNQAWFLSNKSLGRMLGTNSPHSKDDSIEFIRAFAKKARLGTEKSTFKYIHLMATHTPVRMDERLKYIELSSTRANYKRQAKGGLELANIILKTLKEKRIYDNTMVVILADHGFGEKIQMDNGDEAASDDVGLQYEVKGHALPLFLVKPFNSTGEMKILNTPVSLGDVAKTIISALHIDAGLPGLSVFDIPESEVRNRTFLLFKIGRGEWTDTYLPAMTEYSVTGFPWLDESWRQTSRTFTAGGSVNIAPESDGVVTDIVFGGDGNSAQFQGKGWGLPDKEFTWTNERRASVIIPGGKVGSNMKLTAKFTPSATAANSNGQMEVIVNGVRVTGWDLASTTMEEGNAGIVEKQVILPAHLLADPIMVVTFCLPDAASPATPEGNANPIHIAMYSISLDGTEAPSEMKNYQWGKVIDFGVDGNSDPYLRTGWNISPEADFTWTNGTRASLVIPHADTDSDVELRAIVRPYVAPGKLDKQTIRIFVNERYVGDWALERENRLLERLKRSRGFQERRLLIPNGLLKENILRITFELPNAASPVSIGDTWDIRVLGMAMQSLALTESPSVNPDPG
jgi:hypothetical protein